MRCRNCGHELADNARFCDECGATVESPKKVCPRCGAEMDQGTNFCGRCGFNVASENKHQKKNSISQTTVIAILSAVIIGLAAAIFGFLYYTKNNQKVKQEAPTFIPTETIGVVTPTPIVITQAPAQTPVVQPAQDRPAQPQPPQQEPAKEQPNSNSPIVRNPSYNTYSDSKYHFSCKYPAHFSVYNESSKFVRYSVVSPNGDATVKICATEDSNNTTPGTLQSNFESSYPGKIDYQNSGSNWCVIRTISNGTCNYGYFKITDGYIRGFEMHFPNKDFNIYDNYVNSIYNSLSF